MPYVERDNAGNVVSTFANPQAMAQEFVADDDAGVVAFLAKMAAAKNPQTMPFLDFMGLFSPAEQAAFVSSSDTQIRLFLLMASGAGTINLADPRVTQGLAYATSIGLLAAGREAQILAGTAP